MQWYWDPVSQREVCFNKNGLRRYSYNPSTGEYDGPEMIPPGAYGNSVEAPEGQDRPPRSFSSTMEGEIGPGINISNKRHRTGTEMTGSAASGSAY